MDALDVAALCLTRFGFSTLRFCFGKGNGGGRLARGIGEIDGRGLSDEDATQRNVELIERRVVIGLTE